MFNVSEEIGKIITTGNIKTALDLWAGRWQRSLLCANAWVKTIAVDNGNMPMWQFDQTLLDNTNISFIQSNIEEYLLEKNNGFDLILLINVIAFIKKENFLSDILIKITNSVNPQWYLLLSFFFDDDPTMQWPNTNFYTFDDFAFLKDEFDVIKEDDIRNDDLHKPYGAHKHHMWYLIIRKK